jgi:hypothetical protein
MWGLVVHGLRGLGLQTGNPTSVPSPTQMSVRNYRKFSRTKELSGRVSWNTLNNCNTLQTFQLCRRRLN